MRMCLALIKIQHYNSDRFSFILPGKETLGALDGGPQCRVTILEMAMSRAVASCVFTILICKKSNVAYQI